MITPPSSGQIQLNRLCTLMTRKVNTFSFQCFNHILKCPNYNEFISEMIQIIPFDYQTAAACI